MGSRIRENPDKLFEVFLEIAKPENDEDEIFVQKYPPDYNDKTVLKPVPKFAFPCNSERTKVDHFTFVLTDLESKYKYGYCRHAQGVQTCLCIISCLPWFDVFYTILNKLAEMMNTSDNENNVTKLLRTTYSNGVPTPGVPVQIIVGQDMLNFTAPDTTKLPSIPANRNLTEYYSAVDTENMMKLFASMLRERRIIITSKKLSRLTSCVHASTSLLYPMHWQHLFIPILPPHLLDYVAAPMPYVIGIHSSILEKAKKNEICDAVILDIDNNRLSSEYDDLEDLPSEISSYLKRHLKKDKVITQMSTNGDVIPKAFMHALVRLIGGYRDALRFHPGEPITFDHEGFVLSRPPSMQPFLEKMFELQIFQQFINDRLDMLNVGKGFSDTFEMEAMLHADKLNSQSQYKEWMGNMKKQGKKFQKNSKDLYKDFRERMKHKGKKIVTEVRKQVDKRKPPRPGTQPEIQISHPANRVSTYKLIHLAEDKSFEDTDVELSYNRVSINLLSDFQEALSKSASAEDLGTSPINHTILPEESDGSSVESFNVSGRTSPVQQSRIMLEDTSSISSTSTFDSANIPYIDTSDDAGKQHPVPPPRKSRQQKKAAENVNDRLIGNKSKNNPPDRLIGKPNHPPPPKPVPRNLPKEAPKIEISREPLIHLDSPENENCDSFDPFGSNNSSTVGRVEELRDLLSSPENSPSKQGTSHDKEDVKSAEFYRTPAFKKAALDSPKRDGFKPNISPEPERNLMFANTSCDRSSSMLENDPFVSFDPLVSDKCNITTPNSQNSVQQGSDFLHNWNINHLKTNSSSSSPVLAGGNNSPRCREPVGVTSNPIYGTVPLRNDKPPLPPRPKTVVGPFPGSSSLRPIVMENPFYSTADPSRSNSSTIQDRNSDPFSDLHEISITNRKSQELAQSKWEKF